MTRLGSLRLNPAEVGRLASVLSAAHLTLDLDETQRDVPTEQRLAPRLHGRYDLLLRQQLDAERASARLDIPVVFDSPTTAHLLELLDQAASQLEAFADRREGCGYLIGPERFREQAAAARAWRADLAERQRDRAWCQRTTTVPRAQRAER